MKRPQLTINDYIEGIRGSDRAILGRAITLVESNNAEHRKQAQELLRILLPETGGAHRIGISGVPGAGKSTFIEAFGGRLVEQGHRVAVLAVDPSSTRTKGSILGDKTRMERLSAMDEAFIRPSPTGGSLGGVGRKTRETMMVCEAAGFDVILVETVGVGQSETLVADMVDIFLVLVLAGAGDELQGIKRGILEMADIVAVNKADGDNVNATQIARAEYERAFHLFRPPGHAPWDPRAVICSAMTGLGLDDLWALIEDHRRMITMNDALADKRNRQRLRWMWSMVDDAVMEAVRSHPGVSSRIVGLETDVLAGTTTATAAAEAILRAFDIDR
ncbi:MAG: methylmalonyl Co-A mutase-associated GTPase MeaB [Acidobacteria bacterium]|nr:MAG: methylmalonyl Co-A mutase-associated GTPase MeaB [Acidobacteriota bacterium]